MNRVQIAEEVLAVAKSVMAADDVFYRIVPIKFKDKNNGSTQASIDSARDIKDAGYEFDSGKFVMDGRGGMTLTAKFSRPGSPYSSRHTFIGFNQGYGGEGPHGLMEFGKIFGLAFNPEKVMSNREAYNDGKEYMLVELEK